MSENNTPPKADEAKPAEKKPQAAEKKPQGAAAKGTGTKETKAADKPAHKPATNRRHAGKGYGSGLALLALLVGLGAGGGAYWVWQQQVEADRGLSEAQSRLAEQIDTLTRGRHAETDRLDALEQGVQQSVERQGELRQSLHEMELRLGRDRRGWMLAEAEYLLRIGNRRLQLERDVAGAIAALGAASARLQAEDDPALLPVRKAVAEELVALRAVPHVDIEGLSLQLSALAERTAVLPLPREPHSVTPQQESKESAPVKDWRGLLRAMWQDIRSLVVIRHRNAQEAPLLPPEQRWYLRQNLQLKLESARLALLQGDAAAYRSALNEASAWIGKYFDAEAPETQAALASLKSLAATDIQPKLPDISASLRQLKGVMQRLGGAGPPAPAPAAGVAPPPAPAPAKTPAKETAPAAEPAAESAQ